VTGLVPGFLAGIDLIDSRRVVADLDRWGLRCFDSVLTSREVEWLDHSDDAAFDIAAVLGVKEATVKAIGGRPSGFGWQQIEVVPRRQGRAARSPGQLAVEEELERVAEGRAPRCADVRLYGHALPVRARARLRAAGLTPTGRMRMSSWWVRRRDHVICLAVLESEAPATTRAPVRSGPFGEWPAPFAFLGVLPLLRATGSAVLDSL
jgi:phosphopantetheinyl transferase (holo-ACP synthase)